MSQREATGMEEPHDPRPPHRGLRPNEYGDAIADVYDDWYDDVSDVEGTVAKVVELAGGGPVLELGIGTGRLALPLAATGLEVHGIDASEAMVERLRGKPGGDCLHVEIGDFAERLPETAGGYAVVLAAFNTLFNLTEPGAQERCLQMVCNATRPGGVLVVEAFVPAEDLIPSGVDVRSITSEEVVLSVFRSEGSVVHGSLVSLSSTGGVRVRPWSVLPRAPEQLDAMAVSAGFELSGRWGGWRGEPFDDTADRHVTIYRRASGTVSAVEGR